MHLLLGLGLLVRLLPFETFDFDMLASAMVGLVLDQVLLQEVLAVCQVSLLLLLLLAYSAVLAIL